VRARSRLPHANKAAESALEVDGDDGLTVIVNDLIGDIYGKVSMTLAASLD